MTDPGETLPRSLDTPPNERRTAALYVALHAHDVQRAVARHVLADVDGVSVGRGDQPEVRTRVIDGAPWLDIRLADARVSASHSTNGSRSKASCHGFQPRTTCSVTKRRCGALRRMRASIC